MLRGSSPLTAEPPTGIVEAPPATIKHMFLSRSAGRKLVATAIGAVSFAILYEVTALDSRYAAKGELREETLVPEPGTRLKFSATAYCKGTTTASGVNVRTGIAAADPDLLPVGSVVHIERVADKYKGIYTVLDTGPAVQGRHIDIYMWSCYEALDFGRRSIQLTVLRLGWNPQASTPTLVDRLFRQREAGQGPLPSRPITQPNPIPIPR
jgi:3D (Asp-Asp-Asp) domain-containing protein